MVDAEEAAAAAAKAAAEAEAEDVSVGEEKGKTAATDGTEDADLFAIAAWAKGA